MRKATKNNKREFTALLLFITLLVLISIVFSGCKLLKDKKTPLIYNYKVGLQSFSLTFLPGMPPDEIYAPEKDIKSPFQIGLSISNNGAYDIKEGFLALAFERDYVRIKRWNVESNVTPIGASGERTFFSLKGRSQADPYGEQKVILIDAEALPIEKQLSQHQLVFSLTSCYKYETEASKDACLDTIIGPTTTKKICTVSDLQFSGGQGAPVEVTKVEEKIIQDENSIRPQFIIHIKNSGSGEVVDKDKISDACSSIQLNYDSFNIVSLDEVKFSRYSKSNGAIECSPEKIKLKEGEGTTRCLLKAGLIKPGDESFVAPLTIKLSYGYTQSYSKQMVIKRAII
ncbi:MAG: hypothetical protein N3D84_02590 [Candidatus Woesearchaeota archaeon]|nr:hypothetical protein [Candidatus Woesearchaeota archaeon]